LVLEPFKNKQHNAENFISAPTILQETLSRSAITNTITKESYRNENN